jgi:hypothetical protein
MPGLIRRPKDFLAGLIFVAAGIGFCLAAQGYEIGTARRMGPGYFPALLGGVLALIGLVVFIGSMLGARGGLDRAAFGPLAVIVAATALFGVLIPGAGLVPAVIVLAAVSFAASAQFKIGTAVLLSLGLAAFAWAVFARGLGLPMPAFGPWLAG